MDAGSSTADSLPHPLEMAPWKTLVSHLAAFVTAILFVAAGVYKAIDPYAWSQLVEQLLIPVAISMPFTLALAAYETTAGVLVLVPRFRRWGAWMAIALLGGIMIYFAINYSTLAGKDCSCFPWLKRTVNPAFFPEDGAMLLLALLAGWWAKPAQGLRSAVVILGAAAVFVGVSYAVEYSQHTGATAPESIVADGKTLNLHHGRYFIFFYDPECPHCNAAAKDMGTMKWKTDVTVVAVPVTQKQFAEVFLKDNNFKAVTSLELEKLRAAFPNPPSLPYGVVIQNGRQTGAVAHYEENGEPGVTLRQLGVVE